jgi:hypothetical protein
MLDLFKILKYFSNYHAIIFFSIMSSVPWADFLGDQTEEKFLMPRDGNKLSKKIAFAMLGPPREENNTKTFGYSSEEWEKVTKINEKCIEYGEMQDGTVCVNFVCVCACKSLGSSWTWTIVPLIQVKNNTRSNLQNSYFINPCGIVYNAWKDCMEEEIYDNFVICVPSAAYSDDEKLPVESHDQSSIANKLLEFRQKLEPEQQKVFDIMLKAQRDMVTPGTHCIMHGNKKLFRELKDIEDHQEYFSHFSPGPGTQLNINQNLDIDAKAFFQMTSQQRDVILEQSQDLKNEKITYAQFDKQVVAICREYRITFEHQRQEARKSIQEAFQVEDVSEIVIAGKRIFENIRPHDLDRLHQVCKQAGKNYNPHCIKLAKEMADIFKCENVTEFAAVMEYFIRKLDETVMKLREKNCNPIRPPGVKLKDHYLNIAASELMSDENKKNAMIFEFNEKRKHCSEANNSGFPRFRNSSAATNHYDKHCNLPLVDPEKNLSPERYFEIAREMATGQNVDEEKLIWTQVF